MLLLALLGCVAQAGDPPTPSSVLLVQTFTYAKTTRDDGLVVEETCIEDIGGDTWDYSACCPVGWVFLGITMDDGDYLAVCGL